MSYASENSHHICREELATMSLLSRVVLASALTSVMLGCLEAGDGSNGRGTRDLASTAAFSIVNYHETDLNNSSVFLSSLENDSTMSYNYTERSNPSKPITTELTTEPAGNEVDPTTLWQYIRGAAILGYCPPFLIVMATIGNIMSVITLQHPTFRKSSTSFMLSALATVDAVFVVTGLTRQWLRFKFDIDVRLFSQFGCKLHIFLVYCLPMVRVYCRKLCVLGRPLSFYT